MMKRLKLPETYIFHYKSLHKYIHLGNYNIKKENINHFKSFKKENDSEINVILYKSIEYGCLLLQSTTTMLSNSLTNLGLSDCTAIISQNLNKNDLIDHSISTIMGRAHRIWAKPIESPRCWDTPQVRHWCPTVRGPFQRTGRTRRSRQCRALHAEPTVGRGDGRSYVCGFRLPHRRHSQTGR